MPADEEIGLAVVVDVDRLDAPAPLVAHTQHPGQRTGFERPIGQAAPDRAPPNVRDVEILETVLVEVCHGDAHAVREVGQTELVGSVAESSLSVPKVKSRCSPVIADEDVECTVSICVPGRSTLRLVVPFRSGTRDFLETSSHVSKHDVRHPGVINPFGSAGDSAVVCHCAPVLEEQLRTPIDGARVVQVLSSIKVEVEHREAAGPYPHANDWVAGISLL